MPSCYRADVATIYRNSQHLTTLVDDVLDLSRLEADRLVLQRDHIDLERDVVAEAIDVVRPLAERKGLYLRAELSGSLPRLFADKVRLRQALLNVLTNAVRFTERGGITVRSTLRASDAMVSIQDTGVGIATEDMPHVFQEFQQLHTERDQQAEGSGLGLSISRQLVEMHGGEMWVHSVVGIGTTFNLTIPLPEATSTYGHTIRTRDTVRRATEPESCLAAYEDPGIVRALARNLTDYRVIGVPDPAYTLSLAERLHPRAIIASPELGAAIQAGLSNASLHIPIIRCAVRSSAPSRMDGVLAYLVKPISPESVHTIMSRIERNGDTTVLLVDDDRDAVRLLEIMLQSLPRPYTILKAYDGQMALSIMRETRPDVVFVDLIMPNLSGEQTVDRMRSDDDLRDIPIIIISAQDQEVGAMVIDMPLEVDCHESLGLAKGCACVRSLLDAFCPAYLPDPA